MSEGHGGYRKPSEPAPASGPGRLSRRTDGGPGAKVSTMTGLPYGDAQAYQQQQSSAAMNTATPIPTPSQSSIAGAAEAAAPGPDFARGSDMPAQPITNGVNTGPGMGATALTLPTVGLDAAPSGEVTNTLRSLSARDTTGVLAALLDSASIRGV